MVIEIFTEMYQNIGKINVNHFISLDMTFGSLVEA